VDSFGRVLVVGGSGEPGEQAASARAFLWESKPARAVWREIEPLPAAGRILPMAASVGEKWLIFGGCALEFKEGKTIRRYLAEAWSYEMGRKWQKLPDLPKTVAAAPSPCPVIGSEIFIPGGDDASAVGIPAQQRGGFPKSLLAYDFERQAWRQSQLCPAPRATVPCAHWQGSWVIPSGELRPGVRSPEVWKITPTP
jgi:N-acetylneuraminic acid mutarotase